MTTRNSPPIAAVLLPLLAIDGVAGSILARGIGGHGPAVAMLGLAGLALYLAASVIGAVYAAQAPAATSI